MSQLSTSSPVAFDSASAYKIARTVKQVLGNAIKTGVNNLPVAAQDSPYFLAQITGYHVPTSGPIQYSWTGINSTSGAWTAPTGIAAGTTTSGFAINSGVATGAAEFAIAAGTVVAMRMDIDNTSGTLTAIPNFHIPIAVGAGIAGGTFLGTATGTTADSNSFDRSNQATDATQNGGSVSVSLVSRVYWDTSGEVLYAFTRQLSFDAYGCLNAISKETQVVVDTAVDCAGEA